MANKLTPHATMERLDVWLAGIADKRAPIDCKWADLLRAGVRAMLESQLGNHKDSVAYCHQAADLELELTGDHKVTEALREELYPHETRNRLG